MPVAVVTGASSGIGAALCRRLRTGGWKVVGISRSAAPDADEYEACDVADREALEEVAARILERHPKIDLLVCNAGVAGRQDFLVADPETIERTIGVNYLGAVWTLRAFRPGLTEGSHLVNVVSVSGLIAVGPYSASKHAQLAFSRSVAVELGTLGVKVHTVCPGFVDTPGFPQKQRFRGLSYRVVVVSLDLVIDRIMGAIDHDRREIVVPRWYLPAVWLQALIPGIFARARTRLGPGTPP
jgi:NAD(P)-dependent dehydrogenase (short-subunit alcohol dehydrogenase family)